jgi:hypothetical protein
MDFIENLVEPAKGLKILLAIQSIYFFVPAAWPIIHMKSFEKVTGPKKDDWLVKTVGSLLIAIAVTIFIAVYYNQVTPAILCLAMTSALALFIVDINYVFKAVISPVYLLDAVVELIFIFGIPVLYTLSL